MIGGAKQLEIGGMGGGRTHNLRIFKHSREKVLEKSFALPLSYHPVNFSLFRSFHL